MSDTANAKIKLNSLVFPIYVEMLLQMMQFFVQTYMLSYYSENAVAAIGAADQILYVVILLFEVVGMGTSLLMSQYLGAGKKEKAGDVAVVASSVNLLLGLLLSVFLVMCGRYILQIMNLSGEALEFSMEFLKIAGGFCFIQGIYLNLSAICRSYGYAKITMYVSIIINILSAIGNFLLIYGSFGIPAQGVKGAAISIVSSQTIGAVILIVIIVKTKKVIIPIKSLFRMKKEIVMDIFKVGVPSAGETISYNASQLVVTGFIASLGATELATKVYILNCMWFIELSILALGQGLQIFTGYLAGAGDYDRAGKICLRNLRISVFLIFCQTGLLILFGKVILGIFTSNQQAISLGTSIFLIMLVLEPAKAFNIILTSCLRGTGDVRFPVFIGVISVWSVSVVLSYFLGIRCGLGLIGIYAAFTADEVIRSVIMLLRWRSRRWERMTLIDKRTLPGKGEPATGPLM